MEAARHRRRHHRRRRPLRAGGAARARLAARRRAVRPHHRHGLRALGRRHRRRPAGMEALEGGDCTTPRDGEAPADAGQRARARPRRARRTPTRSAPPSRRESAALEGRGRVLLRPSGTEPVVRVMVEAPTRRRGRAVCRRLVASVVGNLLIGAYVRRPAGVSNVRDEPHAPVRGALRGVRAGGRRGGGVRGDPAPGRARHRAAVGALSAAREADRPTLVFRSLAGDSRDQVGIAPAAGVARPPACAASGFTSTPAPGCASPAAAASHPATAPASSATISVSNMRSSSPGIPSRARVSRDGRLGSVTMFVTGRHLCRGRRLLDRDHADRPAHGPEPGHAGGLHRVAQRAAWSPRST